MAARIARQWRPGLHRQPVGADVGRVRLEREVHEEVDGPALLQVMVSPYANAYPKLAFGRGMEAMEPQVKPLEMEST